MPLLFTLAWMGLILCARIHTLETNPDFLVCAESGGCQELLFDPHLSILGLYPADLGIIFFTLLLLAELVASTKKGSKAIVALRLLLGLGFFVALGSLFVQFIVLHKFCVYCLSLDAILILLSCLSLVGNLVPAEPRDGVWALLVSLQGIFMVGLIALSPLLPHQPEAQEIGKVNGQAIYLKQMEDQLATALMPANQMRYETEKAWLDDKIDQSVLEIEAHEAGLSTQELLAREIGMPPPDDDTLWQAKKTAYLSVLRTKYGAVSYLAPPAPKPPPLNLQDTYFEGDPHAPVKIIFFTDYECPFCRAMAPVLDDLYRSHPNDIAVGYWPFPLHDHPQARSAAIAAYCAAQQGRFGEYNAALFTEPMLNDAAYLRLADKMNLDPAAFAACRKSSAAATFVEAHRQLASSIGVSVTPTVLVNGTLVKGMLTKADLETMYQNEMVAQKK